MPAATTKRKSKAAGLDAVENGIGSGKESSAVAVSRKKRETGTGNGEKKPAKKRKKDVDTDGDFQFRRRKSSRLATRTEAAVGPDGEMSVIATPEELAAPATTATKPQSRAANAVPETPVVKAKPVSLPLDSPTPPPPPRATRKKKEKKEDQNVDEMPLKRPASPPPPPTTRSRKPDKRRRNENTVKAANATPEHDASHGDARSRVIQLPTSDTPMQRRNQELRKGSGATGASRRRSSLGMRGRRASSMMQSGLVAAPHDEISHEEFYKHVGSDEMENTRMKQLLVWCGRRALESLGDAPPVPPPPAGSSGGVDQSARHIARVIAESVIQEISTNGALSTWFTRETSPAPAAIKKPNPKNEENQTKEKELLAQLESLDAECSTWKALRALDKPGLPLLPTAGDDDHTALLRPEERAFAEARRSGDEVIATAKRLVKQHSADIEFDMDRFADSVHRLQIYGDAADRLAGQVLVGAGEAVGRDDAIAKKTAGTDALPLHEVLRSISNTSHQHLHAAS